VAWDTLTQPHLCFNQYLELVILWALIHSSDNHTIDRHEFKGAHLQTRNRTFTSISIHWIRSSANVETAHSNVGTHFRRDGRQLVMSAAVGSIMRLMATRGEGVYPDNFNGQWTVQVATFIEFAFSITMFDCQPYSWDRATRMRRKVHVRKRTKLCILEPTFGNVSAAYPGALSLFSGSCCGASVDDKSLSLFGIANDDLKRGWLCNKMTWVLLWAVFSTRPVSLCMTPHLQVPGLYKRRLVCLNWG
jgi:hypothetical protein